MRPTPDPVTPGQQSVPRFTRSAIADPSDRRVRVEHRGILVADTRRAVRTLETSLPPSYAEPTHTFATLRDHVAFYAGPLDHHTVDGEQVLPQSRGFYGGWITSDPAGPFKSVSGSMGW